jgi:probable F420-dependent oxidoreductase
MDVGVFILATDQLVCSFGTIAKAAEDRGFAAIFTGEHDHLPTGSRAWSGDVPLPSYYANVLDPYITLAEAAVLTERIRLGTAVSLVASHDPIRLAKQVSTIDHLSKGLFVFGIGYGYLARESLNHGVEPATRREALREKMLAIQTIWNEPVANYVGEFVSFKDCEQYPKPLQSPRPPVLLGGKLRPKSLRHIVEFCDGWIPTAMMGGESLADDITTVRRTAEDAGRDSSTLQFCVFHSATAAERSTENWFPDTVSAERLAEYDEMGATTVCLPLPADARNVESALDEYAIVARRYLGTTTPASVADTFAPSLPVVT